MAADGVVGYYFLIPAKAGDDEETRLVGIEMPTHHDSLLKSGETREA